MQNVQENYFRNIISKKKAFKGDKEIEHNMQEVALRIEIKIAHLRSELLKWFIGVSLIQTSTFIATIGAALQFFLK
ncbi:hypothetical protein NF27_DP01600 [Candidatus Jidaibacter acanthamoeba]|uniref:Uncharacterized protein n=1 Tax=Candidatus Jidaibacter acanthamoebae TaxID=86105 RepID=A0A0C1MZW0_9RICK|nr:hypothetical protein [Candidatus Jidaibacter acanthamoeba]KIE05616.1 hypothetical protein NF27_DP01600 [Candidatus Jidaibacter acanthamoeba]MBA8667038.1 hypothetical protein [Holosporaceae bacterium 'Namur']